MVPGDENATIDRHGGSVTAVKDVTRVNEVTGYDRCMPS